VGYAAQPVLRGLSQGMNAGEFVALLGPNGAGKTTLLRTLAGLQAPLAGQVYLGGQPLSSLKPADTARRLAVVLTERASPGLLTALELVCLGRTPHTGFLGRLEAGDRRKAAEALELVGAEPLAGRLFNKLSDGERQKVMLARALAQEPQVILLDEPTLHLDVRHRLEVMAILRRLCREQGIAVMASLHDVDLALRLADTVGLVQEGGMTAWGPPETVLSAASLAELYGLEGARFSPDLGIIEPRPDASRGFVFAVCGGGSGAEMLRRLAKMGFGLRVGVLHEHDLDCRVALSLGAEVVSRPPFQDVGPEALAAATESMAGCLAVVDTAFPVGRENSANLELLRNAARTGLPLFSLREPQSIAALLDSGANGCRCCSHQDELLESLARATAGRGAGLARGARS
jgi:iron complex transport system ATP-binding protein